MSSSHMPDPPAQGSYAELLSVNELSNAMVGKITEQIGRLIIEGELEPGDYLNTVELAKRFNTSRTPVREALVCLGMKGLVTIVPQKRPFVSIFTAEEFQDIFVVWTNLLALAAELAVKNATEEQLRAIQDAGQAQELARKSGDIDAAFWATMKFEDLIIECSGNQALKRACTPLRLPTLRLLRLFLKGDHYPDEAQAPNGGGQRLAEAFLARDSRLVAELLRSTASANIPDILHMTQAGNAAQPL